MGGVGAQSWGQRSTAFLCNQTSWQAANTQNNTHQTVWECYCWTFLMLSIKLLAHIRFECWITITIVNASIIRGSELNLPSALILRLIAYSTDLSFMNLLRSYTYPNIIVIIIIIVHIIFFPWFVLSVYLSVCLLFGESLYIWWLSH